jgi:hypothetical protein
MDLYVIFSGFELGWRQHLSQKVLELIDSANSSPRVAGSLNGAVRPNGD